MPEKKNKLHFRVLEEKDVEEFKKIRLEALKKHPAAFLGSPEEEQNKSLQFFKEKINTDKVVGCFREGVLQGIVGYFVITPGGKRAHSAKIWGFYIRPEYRGRGFAKRLIDYLTDELPEQVEKLLLKVHARNSKAIKLYRRLGFEIYGFEKKSLKFDGKYYDDYLMVKFLN